MSDAPAAASSTTKSGAVQFTPNAWLTGVAVAFYSTRVLWAKLREMGVIPSLGRGKQDAGMGKNDALSQDAVEEMIQVRLLPEAEGQHFPLGTVAVAPQ
ncbi:uncharacterized protein LOC115633928 [Scaptodrosophila lebanonensis]|uniref:Uncharacterized protein LOC115633928 n=1 Tax=Drosophila lebanonensis TaxID=7225 RepID=A0A6J2UGT0_DROLE|nr:uncharacterized protein LOC115633928 [Scaptodrosophila lebanonensis]